MKNLVLIGVYDIWVKRGVVSLIGAKLPPSPKTYRVYAPSTHSLPVIKCVSGVDGYAEVEIQSCYSGIYRLDELSPLYNRVWNRGETIGDKATLKGRSRRTFSIVGRVLSDDLNFSNRGQLHTSSDDPLKRPLRPLHLDKQWSATVKALSQRGRGLQALICGPKATGKSTFSRYLLNHLLSPAPQIEGEYGDLDGVAFLDLDPGQPEFSPMGEIYLAHLREPCFGPPFSHPTLENARQGSIVRAHHIGATSPKEDPDHYAMAVMNLMERYRTLRATFPRCPLIINFPGWIFGQGLEVAQWLIRSLGLSDVVYMSEKGPPEVVEPLGLAAGEARVSWTTLPSQPVDFVSRSSAQLRSMQMQSYFHISQPEGCQHPMWSESPLIYNKPILVSYAGPQQGILGVMVLGNQHDPSLLRDILDGSIVSIVAVEDLTAVVGPPSDGTGESGMDRAGSTEDDTSVAMDEDPESTRIESSSHRLKTLLNQSVTRSPRENLPYLFVGAGSCTPLDPKASRTFGLALVRGIHPSTRQLELVTPIPHSRIQEALQESQGLVLVRGHLDNPDWAISEDYHAARSAERKHAATVGLARESGGQQLGDADLERQRETSRRLRERVQRASKVPWMTVVEDQSSRQPRENRSLWKLRKKAYIGSDSDPDW